MADSSAATITKVAAAGRRKELRRRYRALLATGTSTSFTIAYGANTFMTEVRAANGASTQYTVAITRLAPVTHAYLSAIVSVDAATGAAIPLIPSQFDPATWVYRIETHVASVSLTFIAFSEGEIAVDGGAAALGRAVQDDSLTVSKPVLLKAPLVSALETKMC
jgi:hypothetical protein